MLQLRGGCGRSGGTGEQAVYPNLPTAMKESLYTDCTRKTWLSFFYVLLFSLLGRLRPRSAFSSCMIDATSYG